VEVLLWISWGKTYYPVRRNNNSYS
jgi:hypothetical protein